MNEEQEKTTNEVNNFDEANEASKQMFQEAANLEDEKNASENIAAAEREENANAAANEAANVAETAAEAAAEKDDQLQNALAQIQQLQQQNSQLMEQFNQQQDVLKQMNDMRKAEITEDVMPEKSQPTLDFGKLYFMDDAEKAAEVNKYNGELRDYLKSEILSELEPTLKFAREGQQAAEKTELMRALENVPEMSGITSMEPQLERIIANNKALSSDNVPLDEKYIMAYAIARGIDAMNNPQKPPTVDELMQMYNNNSEFRDAVEKQRLTEIKGNQTDVPVMSGSSGNGNIAVDVPEKPKNFEEAGDFVRKLFSAR